MKVEVKLNAGALQRYVEAAKQAAVDTMQVVYTDLVSSRTMPFDEGDMQNNNTWVEQTENGAVLITGSIQARRLYYHPEYNFKQSEGANGTRGAYWLEPYISGDKKDFIRDKYIELFRRRTGL